MSQHSAAQADPLVLLWVPVILRRPELEGTFQETCSGIWSRNFDIPSTTMIHSSITFLQELGSTFKLCFAGACSTNISVAAGLLGVFDDFCVLCVMRNVILFVFVVSCSCSFMSGTSEVLPQRSSGCFGSIPKICALIRDVNKSGFICWKMVARGDR